MNSTLGSSLKKFNQLFFLAIIFFLPSQLGLHFWPKFSIVSGMRIDYLSPTIYFSDLLITAFIVSGLFCQYTQNKRRKNFFDKLPAKQAALLVLFLLSLTIGISFAGSPVAGIFGLFKLVELMLFAVFAVGILSGENEYKRAVFVFALAVLIQSIIAIGQFYAQSSLGGALYLLGERTFNSGTPGIANASLNGVLLLRPYGTLPHPNVLAGYLLIGMILISSELTSATFIKFPKRQWSEVCRIFLVITFILAAVAFMLSMSRSAIFAGIMFLLFAFINLKSAKLSLVNNRLLISSIFILFIFVSPILYYRFSELNPDNEAVAERIVLADAAVSMFLKSPYFGVGLSNYLIELPNYASLADAPLQPVHNVYLLLAAETGIAGLLFSSFYIFKLLNKNRAIKSKYLQAAPFILVAILLLGISDHYFLTLQQGKLLLALSICINHARIKLLSA